MPQRPDSWMMLFLLSGDDYTRYDVDDNSGNADISYDRNSDHHIQAESDFVTDEDKICTNRSCVLPERETEQIQAERGG